MTIFFLQLIVTISDNEQEDLRGIGYVVVDGAEGESSMEIKITGTPNEIKKLLNAISGSKEQPKEIVDIATGKIKHWNPYS